jgi:putative inorganic carbon (HCO3(-)) transporter
MHRFTPWGWLILLAASPLFIFPIPILTPVLLLAPVLLWLRARATPFARTPLDLPILLLSLMLLVSLYATPDLDYSWRKVAGVLLGITTYYLYVHTCRSSKMWWGGAMLFSALGAGLAGLGLLGTNWSVKFPALGILLSRLPVQIFNLPGYESGYNSNAVAGTLIWLIPLSLATVVLLWQQPLPTLTTRQRRWLIALLLFTLIFNLSVFVLAQSRGGYIALGATLWLMLALWATRWRRAMLVGFVLIALLGVGWGWHQRMFAMIDTTQTSLPTSAIDPTNLSESLDSRLEVWSRALYAMQDFPFTGMGMNMFRRIVPILYPLFLISPEVDIAHAHNEFLQVALDLGIPGLIAFIAIYLCAGGMLWQLWRQGLTTEDATTPKPSRLLALGLGGSLFAHLLFGLTDAIALGARSGIVFWMLLGLIASLYQQRAGQTT